MGKAQSKPAPTLLASLNASTQFDRKEISTWYEGFLKQVPTGAITLDHFAALYGRFFPFGDATAFARLIFRRFDLNESGAIEFEEYLQVLSVTSRGRMDEKIKYADGRISRQELAVVVGAIYRMVYPPNGPGGTAAAAVAQDPAQRVDQIMAALDRDRDGFIGFDDFSEGAKADVSVLQGLLLYDGLV